MEKLSLKTLAIEEMEKTEGGSVSCSQASGWMFAGGVICCFVPGLLPLGITCIASGTASGFAC